MKLATPWVLSLCLCASVWADDVPGSVRIVKVLHDIWPQKVESSLARDVSPNEVGKFKHLRQGFEERPDGEYFTVIWKNGSREPLRDVTVTLLYRQTSGSAVQAAKLEHAEVRRGTRHSEFQIVGDAHKSGGDVTAWKVVVASQGRELAAFHSFLWKDPS